MNSQQLKDLAEQAGFAYEPSETLQKFAQLIVTECARVYWNIDQSETHTEYVNDLKKHFGVEE